MARIRKRGQEWGRSQVAEYLGIGERLASVLMEQGDIKAKLRNGEWRTIKEACDVYLYREYLSQDDVVLLSKMRSSDE